MEFGMPQQIVSKTLRDECRLIEHLDCTRQDRFEGVGDKWIMRAAKYRLIGYTARHPGQQGLDVACNHRLQLSARRRRLDARDQVRTGLLNDLDLRSPKADLQGKGARLDRTPRRKDRNAAASRRGLLSRPVRLRIPRDPCNGLYHGHQNPKHSASWITELGIPSFKPGLLKTPQGDSRSRVARQENQSAALREEKINAGKSKFVNLFRSAAAVRRISLIAEIEESLVGHPVDQGFQNRQAAVAGIEHADHVSEPPASIS